MRKPKIVPLGCVPTNVDDGKMLKVGELHHEHDFVFSCESGEDGVLNYEAIACVDAFGETMYPGETRRLSNGTVVLHCNIFGGALKKVVERAAGCYFNETIFGEDEKWVEPMASTNNSNSNEQIDGRLMQCFRPHYSYYESHVVGCVIGKLGVLIDEYGQNNEGNYIKCVEDSLGHVSLKQVEVDELACKMDNETFAHDSEWTDEKRSAVMKCSFGHIIKTKCLLDGELTPIGQEVAVSRGCIFLCHPQTNVYICDDKLTEFKIIREIDETSTATNTSSLKDIFKF